MLLCQLPDTRNLREKEQRNVEKNSVSMRARDMGLLWGFGTFDTLCCRIEVFSHRPCKPPLIKSVAEKVQRGTRELFPLSHTLASHLAACLACFSPPDLFSFQFLDFLSFCQSVSLSFRLSCSAVCDLKWWMGGTCVKTLQTRGGGGRGLSSLTLTGYTACQPCSLGGVERFCTPSPPLPFCPGSSARSPSFPRL